ncbi:hypothetical protein ACCO45_010502 [Purpureocillium lilacinum]|uniref:Uncharacterized protein n=1 Tax=Purpureocillium lilacinum TaxID=33203 RepID=A0ACC4DGG8_PURLI
MLFEPEELPPSTPPLFEDTAGDAWVPLYRHGCTFGPDLFVEKMMNMVRNPNLNSSWLFRADILYDDDEEPCCDGEAETAPASAAQPVPRDVKGIPAGGPCRAPLYHPKVRGIAHLHEWDPAQGLGSISAHFLPFQQGDLDDNQKLRRMAYHLLEILHKHGQGGVSGYVKRVHHDVVIPQPSSSTRGPESTDPGKHVFEDLGIASFLIELWEVMYKDVEFPGFVDIGCGNGLLVYILNKEGTRAGASTRERASPGRSIAPRPVVPRPDADSETPQLDADAIQDGTFPPGTFIVSNHADELTPWTPILGALSRCPFIMIPCCSHSLTGERFRAPPPRDKAKPKSTYASLVDWVTQIAEDCGWEVETEHLRIPSTRNTCLLGRRRTRDASEVDVEAVLRKYGGVEGYFANVAKLVKSGPRSH